MKGDCCVKAQHQKTLLNADFPLNIIFTDVTEFPPHWHEVVEVVYVLDGSLRVGVNSDIYTMNPRDILLIAGGDVHYFVPEPNKVKRLILHFEMAFFESVFPEAKNKRFTRVFLTETDNTSLKDANGSAANTVYKSVENQILAIIEEYNEKQDAYRIALKARLFDILVILLRNIPMQAYTPQERNRHLNRLGRLENVFKFVEENYCFEITLEEISAVANFSEYYFTRFFKEATGMTFGKYINNYRVEKASQLLKNTDDSITEVVFKSGFGSIKTFNRVFKQIKGRSPSSYKKTIFEV